MKLFVLIEKLNRIYENKGDMECLDNEFLLPINKVDVEMIMRINEKEATQRVIIGRDE